MLPFPRAVLVNITETKPKPTPKPTPKPKSILKDIDRFII
jgi:hypothetical protein